MTTKPITSDYLDLRSQIPEGATIATLAQGLYGAGLRLGRMGRYGHTGIVRRIVVDGVERVFVVEENPGGGRYTPLSHYKTEQFDVFASPVDGAAASAKAVQLVEGLPEYDWIDIARLARWGLARAVVGLFTQELPEPKVTEVQSGTQGVICSAFVTASYVAAGWETCGHCAWPSALCNQLGSPVLRYRP